MGEDAGKIESVAKSGGILKINSAGNREVSAKIDIAGRMNRKKRARTGGSYPDVAAIRI